MIEQESDGRAFRDAWIAGVKAHFPGTPKSGYITPWEEMAQWEQLAATAVYGKVRAFILAGRTNGTIASVTAEQGGRFISEAWNVQVYRHVPNPKGSYVADWEDLPEWQRNVDMDIFQAIQAVTV